MKIDLKTLINRGVLLVLLTAYSMMSQAAPLFAHGNDDQLYLIDTDALSATVVGPNNVSSIIAEIEQSPAGTIVGSDSFDNVQLYSIDPGTGAVFDSLVMSFPAGGNVITAMEFVGGTLYAGFATEGGHSGADMSRLVTIDLHTGIVTDVGTTGITKPLGGLAYDGTTMYAVSAGGSGSLYTIDLETGAATLVGATGFATSALEFAANGILYALPRSRSPFSNHLLSIDISTGAGTDLGLLSGTPITGLVGITSPPPAIEVKIDIKPGNTKNRVNPRSKGKLKVAILTTGDFDASLVDAGTVRFGPGEAAPLSFRLDDVDDDGAWDLVLKFNTRETAIACGDIEATLTARTFDGLQVAGVDAVYTHCRSSKSKQR